MNLLRRLFGIKRKFKVKADPFDLGNDLQEVLTTLLGHSIYEHELVKNDPEVIAAVNKCVTVNQVLDLLEKTAMVKSSHLKILPARIAGLYNRRGISDARIRLWVKKKPAIAKTNKSRKIKRYDECYQHKKYYYLVRGKQYIPIKLK